MSSLSISLPVRGSSGTCPDRNTKPPAAIAWLYGPTALGAASVDIARLDMRASSSTDIAPQRSAGAIPLMVRPGDERATALAILEYGLALLEERPHALLLVRELEAMAERDGLAIDRLGQRQARAHVHDMLCTGDRARSDGCDRTCGLEHAVHQLAEIGRAHG